MTSLSTEGANKFSAFGWAGGWCYTIHVLPPSRQTKTCQLLPTTANYYQLRPTYAKTTANYCQLPPTASSTTANFYQLLLNLLPSIANSYQLLPTGVVLFFRARDRRQRRRHALSWLRDERFSARSRTRSSPRGGGAQKAHAYLINKAKNRYEELNSAIYFLTHPHLVNGVYLPQWNHHKDVAVGLKCFGIAASSLCPPL